MTQLKNVPLSSISMIKNYRDVEPVSEKDIDIIELADSIKKDGVLQPILLRPDPTKKDCYQLIFGHRRFVASKVAKQESIPANIKEVADADILEIQVIENMQRKDVHPMDEAVAFQSLITEKKYSIEEIAGRFAKKPEYVAQRLKLIDLIPDLQKDFKQNKCNISHAILLARLTPADQKDIKKRHSSGQYGSAASLQDYIDRNVTRKLSSAPFKREDATLVPKAGPCTTCIKRSGCNKILFNDIKEDDRCFDSSCFQAKMDAYILKKVKDVIETEPNVLLLKHGYGAKVNPAIIKMAADHKVKIWDYSGSEVQSYSEKAYKKVKFLCVDGQAMGKIQEYYIKDANASKLSSPGKNQSINASQLIYDINTRVKRSEELDHEKIMAEVRKQMLIKFPDDKHIPLKINNRIETIAWMMLYDCMGYHADEVMEDLLLDESSNEEWEEKPGAMIERFIKLSPVEKTNILFNAFNHKYGISASARIGKESFMLRELAAFIGVDIASIEAEQKLIADKRRSNADKRIDALKKTVKPPAKKDAPKKDAKRAKKAGVKKAVKK